MIALRAAGNWNPRQVRVANAPDSRRRFAEIERLIDAEWSSALGKPGAKLFDGPMCRMESWQASTDALRLVLSRTSYKVFFGTNLTHPELADTFGAAALANPVGLSATLATADGYLLLGERNETVAYYPKRIHPFAGSLEPSDSDDLFDAMMRELHEELSVSSADISEICCGGIVEDGALRQPEIIFHVRSKLTRTQLEARVDSREHVRSRSFSVAAAEVERAIHDPALTPVAVGTLLLWGKKQFGNDWMRALYDGEIAPSATG